ncbi:MAG: LacI family DNA-binding transcriptional regulator [Anaerolineaceae bacterium]|nr:LacI family DNA-binding transcriptional regulator [Anaerolineaceae bacterium]
MTTVKDVAKKAGVSVATVSHVINSTRFVSEFSKEKVKAAMEELNYRPNAVARSLRRKESKIIGLIIPDNTNPYFAEMAWSIEYASKNQGYSVILCNSDGDVKRESSYLDVLVENQVDGIIMVAAGKSSVNFQKLLERKIPIVMVDRNSPNVRTDSIQINNSLYGEIATEHLVALGHHKIACVTGPRDITPSFDRVDGYKKALSKNKIPLKDSYIIKGDFKPHGGYLAGCKLLEMKDPPTAIFACNDLMAYGVLHAAAEKNKHCPDDLSIVGFDDIYLSTYINPPLTTIKQPRIEMGDEAVFSLVQRIKTPDRIARNIILEADLVIRSSTKKVK